MPPIPAADREGTTGSTEVPLYWREDGDREAPPVLLLHGGPGAHHDYLYPQMLFLARNHRLVTYDQRGGGRSRSDDRTPVTWQTHVSDMGMIIGELEMGMPDVVGYSWGALLAMLYAIHTSENNSPAPNRLVLVSPAPATRQWRTEFESALAVRSSGDTVRALRAELDASGLRETDREQFRQRSFELSVAGYFADPARVTELTPFRVIGRVQQSVWDSLGDYDLRESLRKLKIPSLVVHGRHDPIPIASAEAIAQLLQARFVVLEDSGHVPYVEQPAKLSAAIDQFLDSTANDS